MSEKGSKKNLLVLPPGTDGESWRLSGYIYTWCSSIPGTIHLWTRMGPRVDFPITTVLGFHIIN